MLRQPVVLLFSVIVSLGAACSVESTIEQGEIGLDSSETTSGPVEGDAAVWDLEPDVVIEESAVEFTALVARLDCNGGETGLVFSPVVEFADAEIVITFTVEPTPGGDCPENDRVPYRVELSEPVGSRALVDGACLPGAEAATTAFCSDGMTRRTPQEG